MAENQNNQTRQEQLQLLNSALDSGHLIPVRNLLEELHSADIAHLLESTPPRVRNVIWQLLDKEREGDVLQHLNDEIRQNFIENMQPQELANALADLDTDDVVDILGDLSHNVSNQVLRLLDEQNRALIEHALTYPEDTAGGLMNTDTIMIRPRVSVEVVLRYLRIRGNMPPHTDHLYVVNSRDVLIGSVPISAILTCDPDTSITQIVDEEMFTIPADMIDTEVAQIFERHDLVSAPVLDNEGRLLGRITIDDVVDVIREEADHSLMSMAGLDELEDTFGPVMETAKKRAVWLGINLLTVILAALVIGLFESTIGKVTLLAVLLPIVPSMGGIAGTQTLTLVIRGMSLGHISDGNQSYFLKKELAVSIINGILWAIIISTLVYAFSFYRESGVNHFHLAITIGGAMLFNLVTGVISGASIPLVLKKLNIDPAIAGGVVLTTVTDVAGFFALLGLATYFFA
ncbi:magnesium transporter [Kangiella sediminilitoris]|uniref:Magnesium transporter MgtE n=1 Tax=Kangiella sediminilitoris TaxID=1144748 RepID=A0A1B3BCL8_9GAMM|nr:magnesium transporter [Kangiella sediminilitoris]AOE50508.1 Magnesium transporter [Kangiella sediminilitoris]